MNKYLFSGVGIAALTIAVPAYAAPTLNGDCSDDIAAQAGVTVISCIGGYSGNVLSNNSGDNATINTALTALGYAGPTFSYNSVAAGDIKGPLNGGLDVNFQTLLNGVAYIGVHYGFQGGGATFFYKINATNVDILKLAQGSGGGSTSTATLLVLNATPPVPEPATWAMMIVGFGAMGSMLRRRQKVSANVRYA
ncbi:PEPxxWA-CTERM sorting domain-containing protein [Sphingomonas panacisoli]|uniref:PEPxxWA-CTERM sorting domain-containing protein n=1 Tax=Sphingomonas panacisoli TaxID=1813879 RepID=UPI001646331A|nr:PEPxxWA-CTERM sorting domain-containing protein [Sphingomonas panacisoli]